MESDRQDSAGGGDAHAGREAEGDRRLAGRSRPAVTAAPKDLLSVAAFAAAYFLAHWLAFLFPDSHQILMAVWPPGGIGLASLLLTRRRVWPLLLPCLFIAGMLADVLSGRPLLPSLGYMTANIAESLGCAALIVKFCGTAVRFSRSRDVLTLAAAATLVNGCTALGGAGAAMLGSHAPFWREYRTWWTSDGLGILLVAPLIVSWAGAWRGPSRRWGQWAEFLMFLATWCCLAQMAFAPGADERSFYPLPYVMIAVLAWPCLRFGQRGNTLALALLAVIALAGRPALPASATEDRLLSIQMFLGFIGMSGLFLAASVSERKRSEASLQVSERAYADLYEDAPSACLSVDLSSKKIVKCNRMLEGLVGYSREEIVGRRFTDVIAPESLGDADRLHEELRSRGRVDGGEVTIIRKDGALRNIVIDATAIRGEEGTPLRSRSVWQDITDRKRSEASLRETAAELEAAQRIAHVGSWSWDVRTDEARWTEETFRIFGLPLGHLGQHETNFVQMVRPEDQARVHRALTEALDGAARYDLDYRILRPDGGERAIHANAEVVRDEAGRPAFLRGTVHDITEYKRVQEALQESAQFNEQVIGNVRDGVVVYGADLRYRAWNPAMERITGVAAADVLGRYPVDVFPFPNQFGMVDALREVLDKGTVRAVEVPFQRSDGRHGWISDVSGPLRKKTGEIFGVIAVVRDITERKHAERRQSVVAAMFRAFLTEKGDDAFDSALRAVLEDFASDFGVFGIIDENGDLVCPSVTRHVGELCRMPEKTIVFRGVPRGAVELRGRRPASHHVLRGGGRHDLGRRIANRGGGFLQRTVPGSVGALANR